jgi:hypothetical protein
MFDNNYNYNVKYDISYDTYGILISYDDVMCEVWFLILEGSVFFSWMDKPLDRSVCPSVSRRQKVWNSGFFLPRMDKALAFPVHSWFNVP